MLEVSGISRHFDGVIAVDDVSFSIPPASVTSLIGPNGAGKTTVFNIITGFLKPESGIVKFSGRSLDGSKPHQIAAAGIGRTFQNLRIIRRLPVIENVLLALDEKGVAASLVNAFGGKSLKTNVRKAEELLEFVGLSEKKHALAAGLSYGQQKLLSLACCFALGPKLLLLDEPVAGVNQEMIVKILDLLRQLRDKGVSVFMIEHNLAAVMEISERLIVMDEGRIIADGRPSEVRENPAVIEAYLE